MTERIENTYTHDKKTFPSFRGGGGHFYSLFSSFRFERGNPVHSLSIHMTRPFLLTRRTDGTQRHWEPRYTPQRCTSVSRSDAPCALMKTTRMPIRRIYATTHVHPHSHVQYSNKGGGCNREAPDNFLLSGSRVFSIHCSHPETGKRRRAIMEIHPCQCSALPLYCTVLSIIALSPKLCVSRGEAWLAGKSLSSCPYCTFYLLQASVFPTSAVFFGESDHRHV